MANSLLTKGSINGRLRVQFEQQADRWQHAIMVVANDESWPLLTSLEGTSGDRWPASPPLQSLHFETQAAEKDVGLLVGQAGRAHWSASVATTEANELEFDHACRVQELPTFLGCSYTIADGWKFTSDESGGQFERENFVVRVVPLFATTVDCQEQAFKITANVAWAGKLLTVRWGWRLRCENRGMGIQPRPQ